MRIWKKSGLGSKTNFKNKKIKKNKKIFCKTILLAVRRQSVKSTQHFNFILTEYDKAC